MENEKDKNDLTPDREKELFSNLEFSYSRSKEDVWSTLDKITSGEEAEEAQPTKVIAINWRVLSVAASVVILLSAGLFARFYTTTVHVAPGEFTSHTLPDGSEVHLNAATTISYQPYWWKMDRSVKLNGEAYFVVAKGKRFSVHAVLGTTEVLGTEFNIYARGDDFNVYCETGVVKVTSDMLVGDSPEEVILTKGELAIVELNRLSEGKKLTKQTKEVKGNVILAWRKGDFIFDSARVDEVFAELGRQFGITIQLDLGEMENALYSGFFDRDGDLEEALNLVCMPMRFSFEKTGDHTYLIKRE